MAWEVHIYEPGAVSPAAMESFDTFDTAFSRALTLKSDRPNGWHIHVHAPPDATDTEIGLLQENALTPG